MAAAPSLGRWSTTSEGVVLPAMALVHHMASAQTRLGMFGGTLCQWVACMMRIGIAFTRGIGTGCSAIVRGLWRCPACQPGLVVGNTAVFSNNACCQCLGVSVGAEKSARGDEDEMLFEHGGDHDYFELNAAVVAGDYVLYSMPRVKCCSCSENFGNSKVEDVSWRRGVTCDKMQLVFPCFCC